MANSEAPEPPLKSREELVFLLEEACEPEHGLMCERIILWLALPQRTEVPGSPQNS